VKPASDGEGDRTPLNTFTEPRDFVKHPRYSRDRREALAALDLQSIDRPIVDIVAGFAALPHCFTLQCCYGHFLCAPEQDPESLAPIPEGFAGRARYRLAYLAFCLANNRRGRALRESLARIPDIDPGYVQFGCADWFWRRLENSYVLQVEPVASQYSDEALLSPSEAFHTQAVRHLFFQEIRALLAAELRSKA